MESLLITRLSALSHTQRMAVFKLLMRRFPDAVPAGEIADVLGFKPSTASAYLTTLTQVGLISQRREATWLRYTVNLEAARDIVAGLFQDCCQGRADLCPPSFSDLIGNIHPATDRKFNVLFVCTGNSARSIFAEAILRDLAADRFDVYSAGTAPQSDLNPFALEMLVVKGYDVSTLRPKTIAEFQSAQAPRMDFIFTVCDRAANEECPTWPGQPVSAHWGMPDPAKVQGNVAERQLAFQQVYGAAHNRVSAFAALPFHALNRVSLQKALDEIGRKTSTQDH